MGRKSIFDLSDAEWAIAAGLSVCGVAAGLDEAGKGPLLVKVARAASSGAEQNARRKVRAPKTQRSARG